MNGEHHSSPVSRLGEGRAGFFADNLDDHRLEANDRLRPLVRAMGPIGGLAVAVVAYDRRITSASELDWLRDALTRLAGYLSGGERRAGHGRERWTEPGEPGPADAADSRDADYLSGEALRRRLIEALG